MFRQSHVLPPTTHVWVLVSNPNLESRPLGPLGKKVVKGIPFGRLWRRRHRRRWFGIPVAVAVAIVILSRSLGSGQVAPRSVGPRKGILVAQQQIPELFREVDVGVRIRCTRTRGRTRRCGSSGCHRGRRLRFRHQARVKVRQEFLQPIVAAQDLPKDLLAQDSRVGGGAGGDQLDHAGPAGIEITGDGPDGIVGPDAETRGRGVEGIQKGFQEVHLFSQDPEVVRDLGVGLRGGGAVEGGRAAGHGGIACVVLCCVIIIVSDPNEFSSVRQTLLKLSVGTGSLVGRKVFSVG
mmetsp:Transcript_4151/g.11890  ORF Transcript_4151/g.11890 Transcript_4151/m.11890 type:complete len:293 (+) Transcript_4151:515-1393(+)